MEITEKDAPIAEKDAPMVSVVMATFNEPVEFIRASVGSVLAQTYSKLELIIADDSTSVSTKKAIDFFGNDVRVKILRRPFRMGFAAALNEGLNLAEGKYIARMDADDISCERRLESQVAFLETHPKIDLLGGGMDIIDADNRVCSERYYPTTHFRLCLWTVFRSPFAHPAVMFRSTLVRAGLRYDRNFEKAEDLELWLRARNKGYKWANLSCKLIRYRVVGDLGKKRNKEQWAFNYLARRKNISLRYFPLDLLAIVVVKLYSIIPEKFFAAFYTHENKSPLAKVMDDDFMLNSKLDKLLDL